MSSQAPIEGGQQAVQAAQWGVARRVAFRFLFVYLGLYCFSTQILAGLRLPVLLKRSVPMLGTLWPLRPITFWTATHVFGINRPLVYLSGTGDKTFDWVQAFCLLVLAVLATVAWSLLDTRENYFFLDGWLRVFLRLALASQMFLYGLAKIIPNQMPFPFLTRWVEPFGNFTPMGVLWNSIGAAPAQANSEDEGSRERRCER